MTPQEIINNELKRLYFIERQYIDLVSFISELQISKKRNSEDEVYKFLLKQLVIKNEFEKGNNAQSQGINENNQNS